MTKTHSKSETDKHHPETSDPVLLMLGVGKQLWEREPGDRFVERVRSQDPPPVPSERGRSSCNE